MAMTMKVIDVSKHNGTINFNQVKASGVEGVIIRAGYGKVATQKDINFESNYANAVAAGLHVGAYWYSYAKNAEEAVQEAKAFESVIAGKKFDLPVYLDIEEDCSKKEAPLIVYNFCDYLESRGYFVGVYASKAYIDSYIGDMVSSYSTWVAQWADKCTYSRTYAAWQYSAKGKVPGISGDVDLDVFEDYLPDVIVKNGLNGYDYVVPNPDPDYDDEEDEKKTVNVSVFIDGVMVFNQEVEVNG